MKYIKAFLKFMVIFIVLGIIFGVIYIKIISKKGLPDYNGEVKLTGIISDVVVYRDSFAIPHIYAKNNHDLYLATGYVLAQDRLWQMDLLRRVTQGRLSEIVGESFMDTDWLLRSLNYTAKSEMLLDSLDKPMLIALEAFAEGINQYIETHRDDLPVEFSVLKYQPEKWEPVHSLNLIGYMAWDLKSGWCNLVLDEIKQKVDENRFIQLFPEWNDSVAVVIPDFDYQDPESSFSSQLYRALEPLQEMGIEIFSASNNWAVSGNRSVTGKPLFANDMHLGYNIPGIWYQVHQVVEDSVNVSGVLLPGQPLIIAGHNDSMAWGMTNTYVDNLDFYVENVSSTDSNQYQFNGIWKNMDIQEISINTKEGDTIKKKIRYTHRGPVISDIKPASGKVLSMKWMGGQYSNELRTVYLLNRAANWDDFKEAVKSFVSISQNINYADVQGNIGLYCSAGVPIRKRGEGITFLPGDTDEYDWQGLIPFNELPYTYNPESGFVSSANNKTVGNNYPYHIGTWFSLPHRIERINELINHKEKLSMEDFRNIQLDQHSKMAEKMVPVMLTWLKNEKLEDTYQNAYTLFSEWEGTLSWNSKATGIFEATYINLLENIFKDEMGEDLYRKYLSDASIAEFAIDKMLKGSYSAWCDDITSTEQEDFKDMMVKSFKEGVDQVVSSCGRDTSQWEWGKMHQITLKHPLSSVNVLQKAFKLNRGPYPVGGSYHTVCPYSYPFSAPFDVNHGASHRHIYDISNWDNSLTIIPTGISGIPSSRHYCDQTSLYLEGRYHHDYFSKALVEKNAVYIMVITSP